MLVRVPTKRVRELVTVPTIRVRVPTKRVREYW